MTLDELLKKRFTAGLEYTRAAHRLHDAFVELAAFDEVLASARSGYGGDLRTFVGMIQNLGPFMHPLYAPTDPAKCWREEVKSRRDELLNSFEGIAQ
jgi:hypothetical protein